MSKALPKHDYLVKIKFCLLVGLLVLWSGVSWGQTTRTFIVSNGSWASASSWSPNGVPAVIDNVIFPSTVISVTNIPETTVNGVEIQGTSGTLSFTNSNSGTNGENFLSITSSFSLQSGKTLSLQQGTGQRRISLSFGIDCTATVLGIINITGRANSNEQGVVNEGTIILGPTGLIRNTSNSAYFSSTAGSTIQIGSVNGISSSGTTGNIQTSSRTFSNEANYEYIGVGNQTVGTGLPATVNNLTIANTGAVGNNSVTLVENTAITSNLTVTSGSLNLGSFTANRTTSGGTFTLAANASLLVGGAATTNFPSNYTTNFIDCTSTVDYNFAGDQTVRVFNYGNLTLSGSGIKTLQTATTNICSNLILSGTISATAVIGLSIGGNVNIGTGTSFTAGAFTHSVGGNWTRSGTFNSTGSTILFNGSNAASVGAENFNNLVFSGSGTKTALGNLGITGDLTISNNFNGGNFIHTLSGNWVNNGSFTSGTSTVNFIGIILQNIGGSATTTFHNLAIDNGSAEIGTGVLAGADIVVNGILNLVKKDPNPTNGLLEMVKNYGNYSNVKTDSALLTATYTQAHDILDSWILTMGNTATTTGVGSVTGKIKRTYFEIGQEYSFGSANLSLTFTNILISGLPSEMMVIVTKGSDRGIHSNKTNTVARLFQIIRTGGTVTTTFNIKLNYEDSELNGNTENNLVLWDHHIPYVSANTPHEHGKSDQNTTQNWVRLNNHSLFYLQTGEVIGGNTKYWMLSNTLTEGNKWLGAVNNSWNVNSNWTKGSIPVFEDNVIINDTITAPRIPILPSTGASVKTLSILANGKLDGGNGTLTIFGGLKNNGGIGSWINNGTFKSGTSTVIFAFPRTTFLENATVAGNTEFYNLEVTPDTYLTPQPNATLKIAGALTNSGTFEASSFPNTIEFNGNSPQTVVPGGIFPGFYNLAFTGSGTKTISSTIPVLGDINPVAAPVILTTTNTLTLNTERVMEITPSGSLSTQGSSKLILEPAARYINLSSGNPILEIRQKIIGERGWRMIGTPISTTYSELTSGLETQGFPGSTNPTLQPNLLWWDETNQGTSLQAWRQPSSLTDNAPAGRGHYFYVFNGNSKPAPAPGNYSDVLPITISVTGTEVNLATGIFSFPVTFTARDSNLVAQADTLIEVNQTDQGFNMIANPTASSLDFYAVSGWTKTNIDESIYVWDPEAGEFLTWNGVTGDSEIGRIAPYQAFWVKSNNSAPVLQLTNNSPKTPLSTSFYGRMFMENNPVLKLNIAGEGLRAQSFISFGPDGKVGKDPKDAYRLESLAEDWLLLYSFGSPKTNSPLVINHQPELNDVDRVIPLHLAASKKGEPFNGTYLMDWQLPSDWPVSTEIILMDHINQKAINMREENMYSFSLVAPKTPVSNARKSWNSMMLPQAVIFQTPYQTGDEEDFNSSNARTSQTTVGAKPQRPFSIYIGSFPDDRIEYLPEFPKLFAPVPNPFREETQIRFYFPQEEMAELVIYDLLGQQVGIFPAQSYTAGLHQMDWIPSTKDLPPGMYVIRLVTEKYSFTQKLIKN